MREWLYAENGQIYGPVEPEEVRELVKKGRLSPSAEVGRYGGGSEWIKISASGILGNEGSELNAYPSKSFQYTLIYPLAALVLLFLIWGYFDFVAPDVFFRYVSGDTSDCVALAKDNSMLAFFGKSQVRAVGTWIKNGKMVVELAGYNEGDQSYTPRICVVGHSSTEIVSLFQQDVWQ